MPLQNRVLPTGDIVASDHRGTLTGNRGIIHDPDTRTLTKRWSNPAWIACLLDFKGRRREVMGGRHWTELFFLDEATAFSAGHRPCFYCRRNDANRFKLAWEEGNHARAVTAPEIDKVLHAERLDGAAKRLHHIDGPISELPDGTLVQASGHAMLIHEGQAYRWTWDGYVEAPMPAHAALLTPPSIVRAFRAGYRPVLHGSITS